MSSRRQLGALVTVAGVSTPPLHPDVEPLGFLLGTWEGTGHGSYPTIAPFDYGEAVSIWHNGKPFLSYSQITWALDDERPLHTEMGFLRGHGPGQQVEWIVSHNTGVAELAVGWVTGRHLELESKRVSLAPSAKEVSRVNRRFDVHLDMEGALLRYELDMAAVGQPLQHHLSAELRKQKEDA